MREKEAMGPSLGMEEEVPQGDSGRVPWASGFRG